MDRVDHQTMIVQDIINQEKREELDLHPWYQRRGVWTTPQKAYLINTLFEQKPIPSVYIRHSLDLERDKSIIEVVDGQQRINSILEYCDNKYKAKHPNHKKKVCYSELSSAEARKFKLTGLSVGFLLGATDEDVIEIFGRLNSVAKTLNAQEKRNALFSGEFKQFCLSEAAARVSLWRDLKIFSANKIARMDEVQFTSDLVFNFLNGLSDFTQKKLTSFYEENDSSFSQQERISKRLENIFSQITALKSSAITDTIFSRHPLFFSLCYVINSIGKKRTSQELENILYEIDGKFNSTSSSYVNFQRACESSTQRIRSRRTRDHFIRKHF